MPLLFGTTEEACCVGYALGATQSNSITPLSVENGVVSF